MKTARLEARLEPELKQLIALAAAIEHTSESEFIVKTMKAASEKVLNTSTTTFLTDKTFDKLVEYMESGYEPNENMRRLAKQPRKYVVGKI